MKIAVYTIAKNEEKNVDEWVGCVDGADYVVVADTGSEDGTVAKFQKHFRPPGARGSGGAEKALHHIAISPWRFDDAHNAALALVPLDAEVCIPLHLDERLMPGWQDAIRRSWRSGFHTKAFYTYVFSHNPDGSPSYSFMQNRIHARHGYRWRYPDHEGIYPYDITIERSVNISDLRIEQFQDRSKDRGGILHRLEMGMKEYPDHARMVFYYARELMYNRRYKEAIPFLERYLTMDLDNPFYVERAQAAEALTTCYRAAANGA